MDIGILDLAGVTALYGTLWLLLLEVKVQSGSNVLSRVAQIAFNIEHHFEHFARVILKPFGAQDCRRTSTFNVRRVAYKFYKYSTRRRQDFCAHLAEPD